MTHSSVIGESDSSSTPDIHNIPEALQAPTKAVNPGFQLALSLAVLGIGFGAYLGVDIALITQLLPSESSRGKDLGVINIANALPQVVGSAIAALVINAFHSYTLLFVLAAILASLGAILIQRIKSVR